MGLLHGSGVLSARRSPEIVWDESGGEVVLINLQSGLYFSLNRSASEVWTHCLAASQVVAVSVGDTIYLETFLDTVIEHGLAAMSPLTSHPIIEEEREVREQPHIEVYSDLAEMLLLDPIHDVDSELGWPNISPNG